MSHTSEKFANGFGHWFGKLHKGRSWIRHAKWEVFKHLSSSLHSLLIISLLPSLPGASSNTSTGWAQQEPREHCAPASLCWKVTSHRYGNWKTWNFFRIVHAPSHSQSLRSHVAISQTKGLNWLSLKHIYGPHHGSQYVFITPCQERPHGHPCRAAGSEVFSTSGSTGSLEVAENWRNFF